MTDHNAVKNVLLKYRIGDFMTTNILVGKEEFSLPHITRLFNEMRIHHLPIVDDKKHLRGIITANDVLRAFAMILEVGENAVHEDLDENSTITDFITKDPIICHPDDSIWAAVAHFSKGQFHALPVVEDKELVGVFTAQDLVSFFRQLSEQKEGGEE